MEAIATKKGVSEEPEFKKIMQSADDAIATADNFLRKNGVEIQLSEWVTPKRYSELFGVSLQVVNNWIVRGVIPVENIQIIEDFNDLRLIKAVKYK